MLNLNQNDVNSKKAFIGQNRPANESLSYLFSLDETEGKKVYKDVKGLLKRDVTSGTYKYSSLENFASYDQSTNQFNVYNSWAVKGGASVDGQFFPFNTATQVFKNENGNPTLNNGILQPDSDVNSVSSAFINHYLGLTMDVTFQQPASGMLLNIGQENPMQFKFTGDDDVWIFIDGVLVADLGGIHDSMTTTIDFSTGDVKIYRTNEFDSNHPARIETTIKKQFENANADLSGFNGNTFADNTIHTFQMFYMERGNEASNLELEFNLMQPSFNKLYKVDQDGNGLDNVTFGLYEADDNWQVKGEMITELTTSNGGIIEFVKIDDNGRKQPILFNPDKKYILKEIESLPGYVCQDDLHLLYHGKTGTLIVDNKWETGAVGGLDARVTMTSYVLDANGNNITDKARDGLIVCVPLFNPKNKGAQAKTGWEALYGSVNEGFKSVSSDKTIANSDERYRKMIIEAYFNQLSNPNNEQ